MTLLEIKGLHKSFGGVNAVRDCDFEVKEGTITALIGPNGAGKTTVFNMISGLIKRDQGEIIFEGEPLTDLPPHQLFHLGMARTFQMLRIFPKLTVLENLMIAHPGVTEKPFDRIFRPKLVKDEEETKRKRAHELLVLVGLDSMYDRKAGELSYGQQKLLDIARCLATEAKLIMLDEPVAGVNPKVRDQIQGILRALKKKGRTVLVIEHDMHFVMDISDEIVVLNHGEEIAIGPPKVIKKNKRVIKAYLGEEKV